MNRHRSFVLGARLALVTLAAIGSLASIGCSPTTTRASAASADADVMRREVTAERLEATGDAATRVGDLTRAEQYYVASLKMGGRERVITEKLVAVCAADERYPAAIQYAGDYLAAHPGDAEIRFASAALSAALGDAATARAGFARVVLNRPNMAEAHYALASLVGPDEAPTHYRAYLALQPRGRYAEPARAAIGRHDSGSAGAWSTPGGDL